MTLDFFDDVDSRSSSGKNSTSEILVYLLGLIQAASSC
jgi:hypothetical protein